MIPASPLCQFWLSIHRIVYREPQITKEILNTFGSIERLFSLGPDSFEFDSEAKKEAFQLLLKASSLSEAEIVADECLKRGISVISIEDSDYPEMLKSTAYPPPIIFMRGNFPDFKTRPAVAVVGSRKMTAYGREMARAIAGGLAEAGFSVVSGLAYGIDATAHRAALDKSGVTIGVLGSGFDCFYPRSNKMLAEEMSKNGAVITEFPLDERPNKWNFPMRNRIISGLSLGVVVIEAAGNSGSLITAGWAADQGREVFAVPGEVGRETSKGVHKLINDGAKLVESHEDVIDALKTKLPPSIVMKEKKPRHLDIRSAKERAVIDILKEGDVTPDGIALKLCIPVQDVQILLFELECRGVVKRMGGRYILAIGD